MLTGLRAALFDIDGTLVDSNDAHARAWCDALAEAGFAVPFERVRPLIGMGGDKLIAALELGSRAAGRGGNVLADRRRTIFLERYLRDVRPFPRARDAVLLLKAAGLRCIVASSASPTELDPLLALAGVPDAFDHVVSPDEVDGSKPDPDIVRAAVEAGGVSAAQAVMIGDTRYDIEAAHRSGVRCIALRCGGAPPEDLADADAVFDSPAALAADIERSPSAVPPTR